MSRRRQPMYVLFFLTTFICISTVTAGAFWTTTPGPSYWSPAPERWKELFSLEQSETYTYRLTAFRRGRTMVRGELNMALSGSTVRVWYEVGNVSGRGTVDNSPEAVAGSVLISALASAQPADWTELRLLSTPLLFVQWFDLFKQGNYASSVVWEEFSHPATRFQVTRSGWQYNPIYEGVVRQGRDVVLELEIDLNMPLPLRAVVTDGDWQYVAELVLTRTDRPLLR